MPLDQQTTGGPIVPGAEGQATTDYGFTDNPYNNAFEGNGCDTVRGGMTISLVMTIISVLYSNFNCDWRI
jgi:hypothetical protein